MEVIKTLPRKLYQSLKALVDRKHEAVFIRHNRHTWRDFRRDGAQAEILLEAVKVASSIVSCSYFANYLAKKHNARIVAYLVENKKVNERIYKSFNCEMLRVAVSNEQRRAVDRLFDEIYPRLSTKRDVENLKINGVWIGDSSTIPTCENTDSPYSKSTTRDSRIRSRTPSPITFTGAIILIPTTSNLLSSVTVFIIGTLLSCASPSADKSLSTR